MWRLGSFLLAAVGVWAVLAATRVLRGEEETGRWDLVLAAPLHAAWLTARRRAAVLSGGAAVIGLAVGVGFAATGQPVGDSSVFAIGVALFGVGFVAVGALTSQVFTERRRAASIAGTVLGATYLLRMIADASADAQWLRWFTPFGWVEMLQPFAAVDLRPIVPLVMLPALLVPIVLSGSEARDVGDGLVTSPGSADARTRLLGSPSRSHGASASAALPRGPAGSPSVASSSAPSPTPSSTSSAAAPRCRTPSPSSGSRASTRWGRSSR